MRTQRHRYVHIRFVIALAGDAKTNGTTAAAKVSAAIPVRAFNGLSVMIFLRRLWKIPALTTSLPRSRRLRNPDQLRRLSPKLVAHSMFTSSSAIPLAPATRIWRRNRSIASPLAISAERS
jgi:hypothetical protein